MRPRIALLGYGEAGAEIGNDLLACGADVRAHDPRVTPAPGVDVRDSDADAVRDADLVLSLNSARDALPALISALPSLPKAALWADMNTASPAHKRALRSTARDAGHSGIVDVAIMAAVPGRGLRTPMLAAGPEAQRFADSLNSLGADVSVLAGSVGTASARKLLRSVYFKGLAAAVVEALAGARAAGCEQWLTDMISADLAAFDSTTLPRLVSGTQAHWRRRADELEAASDQLIGLGISPRITSAARELLLAIPEGGNTSRDRTPAVSSAPSEHRLGSDTA